MSLPYPSSLASTLVPQYTSYTLPCHQFPLQGEGTISSVGRKQIKQTHKHKSFLTKITTWNWKLNSYCLSREFFRILFLERGLMDR